MLPAVPNERPSQLIEILPATEKDLATIAALAGVIWREYYPAIISREQIEYMLAKMYSLETLREEIEKGVHYECLFVAGKISGFASFGPEDEPHVFKLHKLYLPQEQRSRGLGSLLLRHSEDEMRRLGARELCLNVNKQNTKAIAAYQRNGFRISDSVVVDIGQGFVMDDYVMTKSLIQLPVRS